MNDVKLSRKIKIGYGLTGCADAIPYNLFTTYFVFFLTDIVGIRPVLAGIVAFVAMAWDMVTDLIMGRISDNYVTEKGRRLPWMKASILPLAVAVYLLFASFKVQGTAAQMGYYTVTAMLVWLFFTMYTMPYYALGGEITSNYNERNILRFSSTFTDYVSLTLTTAGPMLIWEWAKDNGYSDRQAWAGTGAVFAALTLALCCVGLYLLRGCEKGFLTTALEAKNAKARENIFLIWKDCLKIKSFRQIVTWSFVFSIGIMTLLTVAVYYMTYIIGMDEGQQAVFWVVQVTSAVCFLPVVTYLCNRFGKKPAILAAMLPTAVISFVYFFTVNDFVACCFYGAVIAVAESAFYAFYLGFSHDSVETGEFISGERREGSMSAIVSFAQKAGTAVAVYGVGVFLDFNGYDGSAINQAEDALKAIHTSATVIPSVFFIIAIIILATYPVSKKKFELLNEALARKRAGEPYSSAGFEDIL